MARSPFEIFRRNQRQLMVVLTGLAMFSFIFLDVATNQSGRMSVSMAMLLMAALFGGGLWFVGSSRGKGTEFALWGVLLGAVAGFFGFQERSTGTVAQTSIGNFDRNDLQFLNQRRRLANQFVATASKGMARGFGGADDRSLVMQAILLSEAKTRGIAVTDEGVNEFIQNITNKQLPLPEYKKLLRDMGLGEAELFDVLREELAAQIVLEMDLPPRQQTGLGQIAPQLGLGQVAVQTPLSYWKQFQMLQVRQTLDVAEIPVEAFVSQVSEPTDQELTQFFEATKNRLSSSDGKPGFLRDRQVRLAYVAADFEAFEALAQEPTDAEVDDFYAQNKERFRVPLLPDSQLGAGAEDSAPASALEPANVPKAAPAPTQPPPPDLPEEGGCGVDEQATGATQPADTEAKDEKSEPEQKPPVFPELKLDPTFPSGLTLPPGAGTGAAGSAATPEPKYRELDDNLKLEIRETILKQRAFTLMGEAADRALQEMNKLADEYLGATDDAERAKTATRISETLKTYAEQHHLNYVETEPMTQLDLLTSVDDPIGQATEPRANPFSRGETVAEEAFTNDALFNPRRVDSIAPRKSFAYWKIADLPAQVPSLKDVRDKVLEAYKLERAKPLAQKRAHELAELVKSSDKPMAEALSGQTVTGEAEAPAAVVRQTNRFSWLNMPQTLPWEMQQRFVRPQISFIDGVKRPGEEFMRTVFDELGPGEAGVAPNESYHEFYVVQVKQRDAASDDGDNLGLRALQEQFLREGKTGFLTPAYMVLAALPQNDLMNRWQEGFEKRYNVVWAEQDDPARPAAE